MADKHYIRFEQGDLVAEVTFLVPSDGLDVMQKAQKHLDEGECGFFTYKAREGSYCVAVKRVKR